MYNVKILYLLLIIYIPISISYAEIEYHKFEIRNTRVNVVTFTTNDTVLNVNFGLNTDISKNIFKSESFKSFVTRIQPDVAINGPYYNLATNMPVSAIVKSNELIVDGLCHSMLIVDYADVASIKFFDSGMMGHNIPWKYGVKLGLASGPILLENGEIHENRRDEGYRDSRVFGYSSKMAIGTTRAGKVAFVQTSGSLNKVGLILRDLGLTDAFSLDGGGSTAMYYNSKYIVYPDRKLPVILSVKKIDRS